eukprot:6447715-Prymnesium_polylepis.1
MPDDRLVRALWASTRTLCAMGEPATCLQQGQSTHTRPTGEPRPDGAAIRTAHLPPQGVTTRA